MRNKRSFVFGMEVCMKVMQLYNVIGCRHKKTLIKCMMSV